MVKFLSEYQLPDHIGLGKKKSVAFKVHYEVKEKTNIYPAVRKTRDK